MNEKQLHHLQKDVIEQVQELIAYTLEHRVSNESMEMMRDAIEHTVMKVFYDYGITSYNHIKI
jgi:hypothetical protein